PGPWRARLRRMAESRFATGQAQQTEYPEPLEALAARHEPVGPPPEDEEVARQAIEYAFSDPLELSADGTVLVNVEDGAALKPYADRLPPHVQSWIAMHENVVESIKFIDATRAVVFTCVQVRNGPPPPVKIYQEGRAVLVDGRWKVSRETVGRRWAQVGVIIPPPTPAG